MNFSEMNIPSPVLGIIQKLHEHSYEGWLVGGAIRTLLMDKTPKDWDLTTNATPEQVQKIFPHTIETGLAYGTVTVVMDNMQIQVTTFRKEGEYEDHRKPKEVEYCASILDDLSRRDFTMNAIAYNPVLEKVEDPYQGEDDIQHRWIRAVGDSNLRFQEDALRILRALRFQSQLGFSIEDPTMQSMVDSSKLLLTLSRERIRDEFDKWLLGEHFSMTKETVKELNLFQIWEVAPSSSFYQHWDSIAAMQPTLLFRLSALLDLYVTAEPPADKIRICLNLLKSLKFPQSLISKVIQFIEFLNLPMDMDHVEKRLSFIKKSLDIGFDDAILLLDWKLQQTSNKPLLLNTKNHIQNLKKQGFDKKVRPLAIDGNQIMSTLNLQPGPQIREILEELENWVLEHPDSNSSQKLLDRVQQKR